MTQALIITGGTRGIGAQVALAAARLGWRMVLGYQNNRDRAEAMVAEIARAGGHAVAVAGELADESAILRLFAAADREIGPVDRLVNSAGIIGPHGRIDAVAAAPLNDLFAVNITGTLLCCREAIRRMSTKHGGKGGAIVNLSSAASRLAGEGIRVNAVSPGVIDTEIQPPGRVERVGPQLPMKRVGRPEEVAASIMWLLSDEASYVSGAVLNVSGGR